MKTKKDKVTVVQVQDAPIERNVLAAAIVEMSSAVKKLKRGGLTFDAIVVLTQHNCKAHGTKYSTAKPGIGDVRAVLESLEELQQEFAK